MENLLDSLGMKVLNYAKIAFCKVKSQFIFFSVICTNKYIYIFILYGKKKIKELLFLTRVIDF